jgi:hypothetical protein
MVLEITNRKQKGEKKKMNRDQESLYRNPAGTDPRDKD